MAVFYVILYKNAKKSLHIQFPLFHKFIIIHNFSFLFKGGFMWISGDKYDELSTFPHFST